MHDKARDKMHVIVNGKDVITISYVLGTTLVPIKGRIL